MSTLNLRLLIVETAPTEPSTIFVTRATSYHLARGVMDVQNAVEAVIVPVEEAVTASLPHMRPRLHRFLPVTKASRGVPVRSTLRGGTRSRRSTNIKLRSAMDMALLGGTTAAVLVPRRCPTAPVMARSVVIPPVLRR
jgi:hypothetical protein